MKRILFALALLVLVAPAIPRADGADVSVDLFYNNLSGGNWIEVGDYGYGWQPDVAVSNADWRPYADGYWAYTDYGWTWVSYEDFGWATYHYGRWARLADYGWVWFPGSDLEWGPAWVSWRYGSNYAGWAPLPPRGGGVVYEGRPIGGHVDVEFDIGPAYYNFVDVRYIGAPVLRSYIYPATQNVTYIDNTVNVTNITVRNKVVYNYGPDVNVLSQYSERPIQRLRIEREANVDVAAAVKSGAITKVQGDKLVVAAPQTLQRSARQVAPPAVKTKIAKDKVKMERGWSVAGDENAQKQLREKIKKQDLKKIPPPTEPKGHAAAAGGGSPAAMPSATAAPAAAAGAGAQAGAGANANAAAGGSPMEKGKHGKRGGRGRIGAEASPAGQPSPVGTAAMPERGKHKGKPGKTEEGMTPAPGAAAQPGEAAHGRGEHKGKEKKKMTPPTGSTESGEMGPGRGKHKGKADMNHGMQPSAAQSAATAPEEKAQKSKRKGPPARMQGGAAGEQQAQVPAGAGHGKNKSPQMETMSPTGGAMNHEAKRPKAQGAQQPEQMGAAPGAEKGHGKPEGGKKKKEKGEKESPAPQ